MYIEHSAKAATVYVDNGFTNVAHWTKYVVVNVHTAEHTCKYLDVTPHTRICQSGITRVATR
jgi:hypothetical protein